MNLLILSPGRRVEIVEFFKETFHKDNRKVYTLDMSPYAPALYSGDEFFCINKDFNHLDKYIDEIINILKYGTGVVYLGFPECPWCQAYVKYLNETAKDANIEKIYYFNILEDRKNNTEKYQEIVSILGDNLQRDDEGNLKVFVPNVSFVVNGKIIGNDYETSLDTKGFEKPSDYWTEEEVSELENTLSGYMKEVYKALYSCTDCNK